MNKIIKKHLTDLEANLAKEKQNLLDSLERVYTKHFQTEKYLIADEEHKEFQRWFIKETLWTLHYQKLIEPLEKRINNIKWNFGSLKNKKGKITPAMIIRAKEYPIESLLEVNRAGYAKCFNHEDKKPSMYCKGNFAYCFVCSKHWDTIQILIDRDKKSFNEAVKKLI